MSKDDEKNITLSDSDGNSTGPISINDMRATTASLSGLPAFGGNKPKYSQLKLAGVAHMKGAAAQAHSIEETVYIVASFRVRGVSHELDKDDVLRRVHALALMECVVVEKDSAQRLIRRTYEDFGLADPSLDLD